MPLVVPDTATEAGALDTTGTDAAFSESCRNCGARLHGEFCSRCGQHLRDLRQPIGALVMEALHEAFSLDARLLRTLWPLMTRPGEVTRHYLAGRRVSYVTPLKMYLFAALVFFGLFAVFSSVGNVEITTMGSPESRASRGQGGSRTTFDLPERSVIFNERYQAAKARAEANPEAFARAFYANVPRAFFLFLPLFAVLLELFYRKQGFLAEHLVFSLYYHAFAFFTYSLLFVIGLAASVLPQPIRVAATVTLVVWLLAYLPVALRRVYGGAWWLTGLKVAGLGVLYLFGAFILGMPLLMLGALAAV
jgi:hypothetical protein